MIKIFSTEAIREIEARANAAGDSYADMMERAGAAVAGRILQVLALRKDIEEANVTFLIGQGNNGGDGLVAGRIVAQNSNARVRFYLLKRRADDDANFAAVRETGAFVAHAEDDQRYRLLHNFVASSSIIVDALFGIGIRLPLRDEAAKMMRVVNQALGEPAWLDDAPALIDATALSARSLVKPPYMIAVDCPSGLDCDTGELAEQAIHANETITFIQPKRGLFTFPGARAVGDIRIAPIGIDAALFEDMPVQGNVMDANTVRAMLPPRRVDGHKGTYGKVLIIGGSEQYRGAALLAAKAAYSMGAGLVTIATIDSVIQSNAASLAEVTWLPLKAIDGVIDASNAERLHPIIDDYEAIIIGPGLANTAETHALLRQVLKDATQSSSAWVFDADALNILSEIAEWWNTLPSMSVLTPHPGEMARLCGINTAEVQANRWDLLQEKAQLWQRIVVLKGAHTLIAGASGIPIALPFKTSALAKAGTGDALAGMIGGWLAQQRGERPSQDVACAAYLHGFAGTLAAKHEGNARSVLASHVIDALGEALAVIEAS
jgi:ADP-dependent NAD(P)H-hydrate dehydratase / NAD(P)H-hydrate epimerase